MFDFFMHVALCYVAVWFVIGMINPKWMFHSYIFRFLEPEQSGPRRKNILQWASVMFALLFGFSVVVSVLTEKPEVDDKPIATSNVPNAIQLDLQSKMMTLLDSEEIAASNPRCHDIVQSHLPRLRKLDREILVITEDDEAAHKLYSQNIEDMATTLRNACTL